MGNMQVQTQFALTAWGQMFTLLNLLTKTTDIINLKLWTRGFSPCK